MAFSQISSPYKTDQNHLLAGHMNRVLAMCFLVRIFSDWNAIGAATMKRQKERTSTKAEWSLQSYHISCRCPPPGPAERHSNHRTLRKGGRKGPSAMSCDVGMSIFGGVMQKSCWVLYFAKMSRPFRGCCNIIPIIIKIKQ